MPQPAPPSLPGRTPDLAGIVAGPQPKNEISKEEARLAVERVLNPTKRHEGEAVVRNSRLFVGNLDFEVREDEIRTLFTEAGFTVSEVAIVKDRSTGQPRGFAFVDIAGLTQAAKAATQLDGTELAGRNLRINVADKSGRR